MTKHACPLCQSIDAPEFADLQPRTYFQCGTCDLIFLHPTQRPTLEEERAEYDLHENDPADPRYQKFLSKLTEPLVAGLASGACGLDFGSGPGPAISTMLGDQGYRVSNYDPIYAPDPDVFTRTYDFISCTETAEHFHNPHIEFARLADLLRPGGRLGVMTQMFLPEINFTTWRYRLHDSHVVFYTPATMRWIADRFDWTLDLRLPDVALFASAVHARG